MKITEKQHNTYFFFLLIGCIVLTLTLKPPARNYIPVVWGILGYGLHAILLWQTWMALSRVLIDEHKAELKALKVTYYEYRFSKAVEPFSLMKVRHELESIAPDIGPRISYARTYFRLTLIAFPTFALLSLLTVVMTWK